jgi:hypothetical protein
MKTRFWLNRETVIVVNIPGNGQHQVAAEVLFAHLARRLAGLTLSGGETRIVVDEHGQAHVEQYEPSLSGVRDDHLSHIPF